MVLTIIGLLVVVGMLWILLFVGTSKTAPRHYRDENDYE
jgi:hypothetical protein